MLRTGYFYGRHSLIRIAIADDHALIREGIKKIIRACRDMKIMGEADDIAGILQLCARHAPDIIILDISLPGSEGLKGLQEARRRFPQIPVLILSMYPEERFAIRALRSGAAGYITKSMAAEELVRAIRRIMAGGTYVSPRLAELLASDLREPLLGSGRQVKQIAAELAISLSSVNTYRARIFKKTGLASNAALIRYALEHGLAH
jgi:DNA-binding NarL/FixJ family response regulator